MYELLCLAVFIGAYLLNICYISVFYHRGLTHQALTLSPKAKRFVVATGAWVTGLDPKGWCTMHRLHHRYSDTPKDPHSPVHKGFFMIAYEQLQSYKRVLKGLIKNDKTYTSVAGDFDFDVSWMNKKNYWYLPYLLHLAISAVLVFAFDAWLLGAAYYLGIMSHPIQGWMVNSMGHALGYRNFNTTDNSKNNSIVAWLVAGEGYQNNHHRYPRAVKFSMRWWEVDWGYAMCWVLAGVGVVSFEQPSSLRALDRPEPWDLGIQSPTV
ncbi:MAG: acyl-CoA desaturase [Pseudobacteriovorax sp.]|nr:acyl-CoA desaturase [Pseudobacteriovorax sp.]